MASIEKPKTAVIFLGNSGTGKSALLSQIGGDFSSGLACMEGLTKEVAEQVTDLGGEQVILMDTPGLYETSNQATKANAEKLTEALRRGYNYKIFIVLKATNRLVSAEDLSLISQVNKSIHQANGAKIEVQVIVNQIQDEEIYNMYMEKAVKDNFREAFEKHDAEYGLDIEIIDVMLVPYDKAAIKKKQHKMELAKRIVAHPPVQIKVKALKADNSDVAQFKAGLIGFAVGGVTVVTVAAAAVVAYTTKNKDVVEKVGKFAISLLK